MTPDKAPYEQQVRERADLILAEYQGGAYPEAMPEHPRGECVECDALRLLADRDLWERDDAR